MAEPAPYVSSADSKPRLPRFTGSLASLAGRSSEKPMNSASLVRGPVRPPRRGTRGKELVRMNGPIPVVERLEPVVHVIGGDARVDRG